MDFILSGAILGTSDTPTIKPLMLRFPLPNGIVTGTPITASVQRAGGMLYWYVLSRFSTDMSTIISAYCIPIEFHPFTCTLTLLHLVTMQALLLPKRIFAVRLRYLLITLLLISSQLNQASYHENLLKV